MQSAKLLRNPIPWADIHTAVHQIARDMADENYHPNLIVGVSRGGAIPAVALSSLLGAITVDYIHVSRYRGVEGCTPQFRDEIYRNHWNHPSVLFIDDLWDAGLTMEAINNKYPEATLATLFWKGPQGSFKPPINYPGKWQLNDCWLVFPWELGAKV